MWKTKIVPKDLNTTNSLIGSLFNKSEKEVSASWIIQFCQKHSPDSWSPFSEEDLVKYYQSILGEEKSFCFNGLIGDGFIVRDGEMLSVTDDFVRCVANSALKKPDKED